MAVLTLLMKYQELSRLPVQVEIVAIVGALGGAFWFSKWYPQTKKRRQHAPALQ